MDGHRVLRCKLCFLSCLLLRSVLVAVADEDHGDILAMMVRHDSDDFATFDRDDNNADDDDDDADHDADDDDGIRDHGDDDDIRNCDDDDDGVYGRHDGGNARHFQQWQLMAVSSSSS